jgi:hypothetical protein
VNEAQLHFLSFVDVGDPDGCWPWTGGKTSGNYGYYNGAKTWRCGTTAHRASYELFVGPIAITSWTGQRIHVDHVCHNESDCPGGDTCLHRLCVNPGHLEAVPIRVNNLRGKSKAALNAVKDVCDNGHPYDPGNTYNRPDGDRDCRKCKAARMRATYRDKVVPAPPTTFRRGTVVRIWGKKGRYSVTGTAADGRIELAELGGHRSKVIQSKYVVPLKRVQGATNEHHG